MKTSPSIRRQLLRSLFGSLLLLYSLGSLIIYFIVQQAIERKSNQLLHQKLQDFAEETRYNRDRHSSRETRLLVHDFFDMEFCQISDESGRILVMSDSLDEPLPLPMRAHGSFSIVNLTLPNGDPGRVGYFEFFPRSHWHRSQDRYSSPPAQSLLLSLAISTSDERATLQILALTLICSGAFMGIAIFFIVRHQVTKSYRPIEQLVALTGSIQPGQLSVRLPCENVPAELTPLVAQFNTLLDRLESAFVRERSFSASLGHEIRTPLTELAALLGNAEEDIREISPVEEPEMVYSEANKICRHMNRLIEVISSVHLAESGRQLVNIETTDPATLLSEVVNTLGSTAPPVDIDDLRKVSSKQLRTDSTLVKAIFQNLISNASTYSKHGTCITCRFESMLQNGGQKISISNIPADLSEEDVKRITDPFWQKDKSRTGRKNFGLGLSLVSVYGELLEAQVDYHLSNSVFTVTIVIPGAGAVQNRNVSKPLMVPVAIH